MESHGGPPTSSPLEPSRYVPEFHGDACGQSRPTRTSNIGRSGPKPQTSEIHVMLLGQCVLGPPSHVTHVTHSGRGVPRRVCLKKCISCLRPIAMACTPCQCLVREGIIAQAASGQFADRSTDRPLDGKECGSTTCSPYVHACIHPLYSGMYAFPDQVHTYKPGVRRLAKWGTVQGLSRFD